MHRVWVYSYVICSCFRVLLSNPSSSWCRNRLQGNPYHLVCRLTRDTWHVVTWRIKANGCVTARTCPMAPQVWRRNQVEMYRARNSSVGNSHKSQSPNTRKHYKGFARCSDNPKDRGDINKELGNWGTFSKWSIKKHKIWPTIDIKKNCDIDKCRDKENEAKIRKEKSITDVHQAIREHPIWLYFWILPCLWHLSTFKTCN